MAHIMKYNRAEAGHLLSHYFRKPKNYKNTNVDLSRTHLNYNLGPYRAENPSQYIDQMLGTIAHAKRKDLVVMADWIITAPKELPESLHRRFFELSYSFLIERYGSISGLGYDVCIAAVVHEDEGTTPHLHFSFLPIVLENGTQRFCAKKVITKTELSSFHADLDAYLRDRGIRTGILNGRTKFDSNGRALSIVELKRQTRERNRARRRF